MGYTTDPQNLGGKRSKHPGRTPGEHRQATAAFTSPPPVVLAESCVPLDRWRFRFAIAQRGFASYEEYLNSGLWFGIRRRVLKNAHQRCEFCGTLAQQVHHEVYTEANLSGESLEGLYATCWRCHEARHFPPP